MHPLALPCLAMSAVNTYLAAYHLVLALRRPAVREHLPFALLCASVATYEVFCVGLYHARSLTEGVFWQGFQIQSIVGISLMTVWFVARLTGNDGRRGVRWTLRWFMFLAPVSFLRGRQVRAIHRRRARPARARLSVRVARAAGQRARGPVRRAAAALRMKRCQWRGAQFRRVQTSMKCERGLEPHPG